MPFKLSGTESPNLMGCVVTDGVGEVVYANGTASTNYSSNENSLSINSLYQQTNSVQFRNTSLEWANLDFEIDGLKIKGTISGDEVNFSVEGNLFENASASTKINGKQEWSIKDIGLNYDYNFSWGKLKYAYAALNYTVENKTKINLNYDKHLVSAPRYSNGNGKFLTNFRRAVIKDSKAKGAKMIKIFQIKLNPGSPINICLDVRINITASGEAELVITSNNTKGIEYVDGQLRFIKDQTNNVELDLKVAAEATMYIGISIRAISINIIGFGADFGIGIDIEGKTYLTDENNHLLDSISYNCDDGNNEICNDLLEDINDTEYQHEELGLIKLYSCSCYDVETYFILKMGIDTDSNVAKLLAKKNITLSWEFFGKNKDNSKIDSLCFHLEDGKRVDKCTRKFNKISTNTNTTDSTTSLQNKTTTTTTQRSQSIIQDNTYRDIVLVLDTSGSMGGDPFSETAASAKEFVNQVAGGNTRVGIVSYDTKAHLISQLTNNISELTDKIDELVLGNVTNMYSGLFSADDMLKQSNAEKKIIVLMSDGLPNESPNIYENTYEPYGDEVVEYSSQLKNKGYYIYTLGFFQNLSGSDLVYAQNLMSKIAGEGYYYDVNEADSINFFFNDVATDIAGQHSILIKIACPVDVYVTYNGETLTSNQSAPNNRTSFGSISYTGENDEVKNVRLLEGANYDIVIKGTGEGTMDYSISYPDETGAYTDIRTFEDIPITDNTIVETNTKKKRKTVVKLDSNGDGHTDIKYQAGENSLGEVAPDYTNVIVMIAVLFALAISVKLIGVQRIKRLFAVKNPTVNPIHTYDQTGAAGYCGNCGGQLESGGAFCPHCGFDNTKPTSNAHNEAVNNVKYCGNCGHKLSVEVVFCDECRHDTREDKQ